ncbi:DUF6286 domain-containing protein [Streptomyces xiamenensis]|uniref:Membrane protein n=1 Tax=Streptomyces xiamenensis TaxID=408015 RepID=A0A0F7FQ40_9ACTN|nr:DUF6286 domain-containing protein [Streptomyces xiamenensis]AKG42202.1 membrane protein [Streptomyces xiamenensis]
MSEERPVSLAKEPEKEPQPDVTPAGGMAVSSSAARYEPEGVGGQEPAGRFWSVRRCPAAFVALVLLLAAALLLYDVASVRADRPVGAWRRRLADEFATRPLDDPWVIAAAGSAVVLGLVLIVLALTPGLRGLLPMRRDSAVLRAGIERRAAAVVLRDRGLQVPGVRAVRVRVGRRRVRVRAQAHFRDLHEVRADLDEVLEDGIAGLGLARQPALTVQVRRPKG